MASIMEWIGENRAILIVVIVALGISLYALATVDSYEDKLEKKYVAALQECYDRYGVSDDFGTNLFQANFSLEVENGKTRMDE